MPTMLEALLRVQSIERDLAHVRGRLRARRRAVTAQEKRIEQLQTDWDAIHQQMVDRRKKSDSLDLDLTEREEQVNKLRGQLNTAKTNKEYASILTQINTIKADNARIEEEALKVMQDVDSLKEEADKVQAQIDRETKRLEDIRSESAAEIERLEGMLADLQSRRDEAAEAVPPDALAVFNRIAESNDGDAMAVVEQHGRKPPYSYICGGCYMSLSAEHANALQTRDEIRTCDNCGRILYLETQAQNSTA